MICTTKWFSASPDGCMLFSTAKTLRIGPLASRDAPTLGHVYFKKTAEERIWGHGQTSQGKLKEQDQILSREVPMNLAKLVRNWRMVSNNVNWRTFSAWFQSLHRLVFSKDPFDQERYQDSSWNFTGSCERNDWSKNYRICFDRQYDTPHCKGLIV